MVNTLKLPVGIDSFEKIRRNGFADAKRMLGTILANEMDRHYYLKTSDALTDEDKAYQNGYYREMVSLIRGLFGQALKTNDYLQFAFLTGCVILSNMELHASRRIAGL